MAIIQISKIQQRSGNLVDLPQLDEAQFGWATDAKRLFIGKTSPNENIEVLTSYSNISFSQIDGAGNSNVNITTASLEPGQVLTYDSTINSWINTGGNIEDPGNSSYFSGQPVHLGSVSNVKIGDGAVGYVLTTDGYGNLNWSSKTTVIANIIDLSDANPAVMTVDSNIISYTNGTAITILGIAGNSSANANLLNGNTFYVKVANDFDTTGNASLYISDALDGPNAFNGAGIVYDNPANVFATATSAFGTGGSTPAAGTEGSIQYNVSGVLTGSALLKFANSNVEISTSNVVVSGGNVIANVISGNVLTGTLSTNAQPNITSVGSLASLSVVGNANIGNIGTAGLITATGNISGGNLVTGGILTVTGNATVGNIGTAGLITATGNITGGNLITGGIISATGNANVGNIGATGVYVTTVSATGNANIGNIGTAGLVTATGNIQGGNLVTGGVLSVTGNANVGNIGATGVISTTVSATGNGTFGNIDGGNLVTANNITVTGISDLGSNVNVRITGGNLGDVLVTYGDGNLAWGTILFDALSNGTSNLLVAQDGNVTTSVGGVADVLTVTGTGLVVAGDIIPSANVAYDLGNATNQFKDLYLSGNTIYIGTSTITANTTGVTINTPNAAPVALKPAGANTQIQYNDDGAFGGNPTLTFNELTSTLTANNFVASSTANLGAVGNVKITGGSANYVLQTDGAGNLSWTAQTGGGGNSTYGDSNVVTLLSNYGSNSISTTGNVTAKFLINSVTLSIAAAGTVSSNATVLTSTINLVTSVAAGAGVKLPSATGGMTVYITNTTANSLIVYPNSGAINSAAASYTQPANSTIHYIATSSTQWYTVGASPSFYV